MLGSSPTNFPRNPLSLTNTIVAKANPDLIQVKPVLETGNSDQMVANFSNDWNDFKRVLRKGEVACAIRPELVTEKGLLSLIDEQIDVTNRMHHKIERASDEALKGMARLIQEDEDPGLKKKADPQLLESLMNLGRGGNLMSDFKWDQDAAKAHFTPMSPVRFVPDGANSLLNTITVPFNRNTSNTLGATGPNIYNELDSSMLRGFNDYSFDGLYLRSRQTSQMFVPVTVSDKDGAETSRKGSEDHRPSPVKLTKEGNVK
jgi:hypothetical protein